MISKKVLIAAVLIVAVVGVGSASVLESFGVVSGTADVEPAVEFVEVYYESTVSGQDSGEYLLLRANTPIDLENWGLKNGDSFSGEVNGLFALVDNTTQDASFSVPEGENVGVINAGNLASNGLSSAEDFEFVYSPESKIIVEESYNATKDNFDCGDSEAYVFNEGCQEAFLDVEEVSSSE